MNHSKKTAREIENDHNADAENSYWKGYSWIWKEVIATTVGLLVGYLVYHYI